MVVESRETASQKGFVTVGKAGKVIEDVECNGDKRGVGCKAGAILCSWEGVVMVVV